MEAKRLLLESSAMRPESRSLVEFAPEADATDAPCACIGSRELRLLLLLPLLLPLLRSAAPCACMPGAALLASDAGESLRDTLELSDPPELIDAVVPTDPADG